MSVTPPDSGTTITAALITAMHEAVRAAAHAVDAADLARAALGARNLPSVLIAFDALEVTAETTVSTPFGAETAADILTNWVGLNGFTLSNGGAGYVIGENWQLVAFATIRIENFYDLAGAEHIMVSPLDLDEQAWVALTFEINGVESVSLTDTGFVHGQTSYSECEEIITIWSFTGPYSAATLNALRVRAAKNYANAGVAWNFKVKNGFIGFIAIPPNS